ncbi:MAG: glutamine amidotransferase [Planctomycetaceae bacterium]
MPPEILYCGDTHLQNAACYLAGLLCQSEQAFRYRASDQSLTSSDLTGELRLIILSDFPSARCDQDCQRRIVSLVEQGAGLLMLGGWESYHGLGGDWGHTEVGEILPVTVSATDDRLNSDQPLLVRANGLHAITSNLPWTDRPPYVGGLNRFAAKAGSDVLLEVDRLRATRFADDWSFDVDATWPLLVVGKHGLGRTAAFATDVAPHWVGGFVDWGSSRVSARAPDADAIEVGNLYAQFFLQLIRWTKGD